MRSEINVVQPEILELEKERMRELLSSFESLSTRLLEPVVEQPTGNRRVLYSVKPDNIPGFYDKLMGSGLKDFVNGHKNFGTDEEFVASIPDSVGIFADESVIERSGKEGASYKSAIIEIGLQYPAEDDYTDDIRISINPGSRRAHGSMFNMQNDYSDYSGHSHKYKDLDIDELLCFYELVAENAGPETYVMPSNDEDLAEENENILNE